MKHLSKLIGAACFFLLSFPTQAAGEFIKGVRNELTLMYALGIGSALLLVCLLTLMYMLAKAFPMLLKKRVELKKD